MLQLPLLGTAFLLGLRHGIDLDHVAAIVDISGASAGNNHVRDGLKLSLLYALGHALVIAFLGFVAINFAPSLPPWIDDVMERVVGITLVVLGLYLLNTVFGAFKNQGQFKLESRWLAFFSFLRRISSRISGRPLKQVELTLNGQSTFFLGMLHGIGAETATQVLLLSAVGGLSSHLTATFMLLAFVVGLVTANFAIAIVALGGFGSFVKWRPLYLVGGILAGGFSLIVGGTFIAG